jgi:hypothetical protein
MWKQVNLALQESLLRVVYKVATLLPSVLALLLAISIFTLIGWLFVLALRRFLMVIQFDKRIERWRIANFPQWFPSISPTSLATRIIFWTIFMIGIFTGMAAFDASSAPGLSSYMVGYFSKIVAAFVLLIIGIIVARFLSRSVLISSVNMNLQHARLLSLGVKWLVLVFTAAMVLDHLAIARGIVELGFGILFGGIVLALALAIGLGSRDMVSRSLERERNKPSQEEDVVRHY